MAKGKKNEVKSDKKQQKEAEHPVETKENTPAAKKDKSQSFFQTLRTPGKPRSPLADSSSMLIQEGNESDAANPDVSKLKKGLNKEIKEQTKERAEQKEPGSAADVKVSAPKPPSRPGRKPRNKKTENNKTPQNRKVTDFYPIRRSNRKTKEELKNEEHKHIDDLIRNGVEEGLKVKHIEGKGRGVFAVKGFKKGDFVVEYHGDLTDISEAKAREAQYSQDPQTGCYMYYFQYQSKTYCVDATKETSRCGRLINHSKTGNCQTRLHAIDGTPHLILVASRDISAEEELLYDYGDRSKASISAHPWLKY